MASEKDSTSDEIEAAALSACQAKLAQLQTTSPDWFAYYEDAIPDTAERSVLADLLFTAPNDFARGVLYGKFVMRMEMATIAGRGFE